MLTAAVADARNSEHHRGFAVNIGQALSACSSWLQALTRVWEPAQAACDVQTIAPSECGRQGRHLSACDPSQSQVSKGTSSWSVCVVIVT